MWASVSAGCASKPHRPRRRAGFDGELGRAAQHEGAEHQAEQRDEQAGPERRPEPIDLEAIPQLGHQQQHQRVDHQQEQAKAQQRQGQREHHQQRPHHCIGQPQQQGRDHQRRGAAEPDALEQMARHPQGEGGDGPVEEEGG